MRTLFILLTCAFTCVAAEQALSAIQFKRFPHCPEGLVTKKTCECHAGTSRRFHYCHAGYQCDTSAGKCSK